ncbi:hypothetical protein GCM10023221_12700 [Luteimicrobium xylanilyticum]|uniref:Uncharacterized protein n=1 Tax=Luteimicrobium xylanilyticum TaxID=1133546 RepID=A0A5P9QD03_9MICO|nr:hypothetical protein [Luteimicrobium xylanilyticum]QFU99257.1 hypothetical protein KDY119_02784 [Luteimicrobium xylanilyticum]
MPRLLRRGWVAAAAIAAVCTVIGWLRLTTVSRGTFWAEDGNLFLQGAVGTDGAHALPWDPYQGYLHVVPRLLLALSTAAVPPAGWAYAVTACCVLITGLVAGIVYVCATSMLPSQVPRIVLAAVTVLTPVTAIEVLGNAANVHTYFLWLTPWLLLARPTTLGRGLLLAVPMLLGALTEIQTALFFPLVLVRWRDPRTLPVKLALLVGIGAQLVATALHPRSGGAAVDVPSAVERYLSDALLTPWLGTGRAIPVLVGYLGFKVTVLAVVPVIAALVIVLRKGTGDQKIATVALVAAGAVSWSAAMVTNGTAELSSLDPAGLSPATRHAAAPSLLLLGALVIAGTVAVQEGRRRSRLLVGAAGAVLAGAAVLSFVPAQQLRSPGPAWGPGIEEAVERCSLLPPGSDVTIPIAPQTPSPWSARVPCHAVIG